MLTQAMMPTCSDENSNPLCCRADCLKTPAALQPIAGEPFPASSTGLPRHVELMQAAFKMQDDPAAMIGVSRRECVAAMAEVLTGAPCMLCLSVGLSDNAYF